MIIPHYKPIGQTSFSVIREYKNKYPGQKIGYVGTLDPMAEGLLIILVGLDTKKCEELVSLPKEYEFEVVFGIGTDSGDVLGLVKEGSGKIREIGGIWKIEDKDIKEALSGFRGSYLQTVPVFSSVKSGGRELYKQSKSFLENPENLPKRSVSVYEITLLNCREITIKDLEKEIFARLNTLKIVGDQFRKPDVVKQWEEYFEIAKFGAPAPLLRSRPDSCRESANSASGTPAFYAISFRSGFFGIAKIRATASKGTYIRSLAEDIGKKLGFPYSMCLSIKRTKVGPYLLENTLKRD